MPEGDTVHDAARRMRAALEGHRLVRAELRVPRFAAVDLAGRTVTGVRSRGKHLIVDVGPDDRGRDPVVLHLHLKMEGRILVHPAGTRWRFPAHTVRLLLATTETEVVGTELGFLRALAPAEAEKAVAHLGPDLLGDDWDAAEARRRLAARPERTLGEALLDQRNLAGLGTIYRSELCFLRGLDPRDTVGDLPDGALDGLLAVAPRLLTANLGRHDRVTTGDPRPGRRLWVYGRGRRPCLRCGTPVVRFMLGGARGPDGEPPESLERVGYRCPTCQAPRGTLGSSTPAAPPGAAGQRSQEAP